MEFRQCIWLVILFLTVRSFAQDSVGNYYWIQLQDKNGSAFSLARPQEFLSVRAIARRKRQQIAIDESDLPVSKVYLDSLTNRGLTIVHCSRWLNGCTVKTADSHLPETLANCTFVKSTELTKPATVTKSASRKTEQITTIALPDTSLYGSSVYQISQLRGISLPQDGFQGQGMLIAVLDAGFLNADKTEVFTHLWNSGKIVGIRDFVASGDDFFNTDGHGSSVLSTIGGYVPNQLIGTAPLASFVLLRTEDAETEYPVEEDNWVAAAEYADSLGVDVINSSLGYSTFDDSSMNHSFSELDGKTTRVTRGANMAAQKGMLVFASAGNEANKTWKRIIAPADGDQVIAVGAVDQNRNWAYFSSLGPSADGDVKPNLAAMGLGTTLLGNDGTIKKGNGTSFSSPVLAGMSACLWQAHPEASAAEIKDALQKSASQYSAPDEKLGFGIPNFELANQLLSSSSAEDKRTNWTVFPNPFSQELVLTWRHAENYKTCTIRLLSLTGTVIFETQRNGETIIVLNNPGNFPQGLLLLNLQTEKGSETFKILRKY